MQKLGEDTSPFRAAMAGDYKFSLKGVLKLGARLYAKKFFSFFAFSLLVFFSTLLVSSLVGVVIAISNHLVFFNWLFLILGYLFLLGYIFSLSGGMFFYSEKLHVTGRAEFRDFFRGLRRIFPVGAAKLIQLLIVVVPLVIMLSAIGKLEQLTPLSLSEVDLRSFQSIKIALASRSFVWLALLPQVLVSTLYLFATPLILLGDLHFWTAMETSRHMVTRKFWPLLLLTLLLALMLMGSTLVVVIGLILLYPLIYTVVYATFVQAAGSQRRMGGVSV